MGWTVTMQVIKYCNFCPLVERGKCGSDSGLSGTTALDIGKAHKTLNSATEKFDFGFVQTLDYQFPELHRMESRLNFLY